MKISLFQVDAFTRGPFSGNPAAVCPLIRWLPDATLQGIALENNLSETAFLVDRGEMDELLVLDFPSLPAEPCDPPLGLIEGLGARPAQTLLAKSYLAVFESE